MRRLFLCLLLFSLVLPLCGGRKMPVTSPLVLFGENALTIKDDATFTATDKQAFVDLDDLKTEIPQNRYITWEPDFWKLDGNYKFRPTTNARAGWVSLSMSDGDSAFFEPPLLTITFDSVHSTTSGLTLYFSQTTGDWPTSITIEYYNSIGGSIRADAYSPSSSQLSTNQAVSNFKSITILFHATNKPYRYIRLLGIDFDTVTRFSGAEIKQMRVTEQISPLSIELPINEISMTLHSTDGDFSIVDPQGVYATLHENQPIDVYEQINADMVYIGRFYLYDWNSTSENEATIKAHDAIGLLDGGKYYPVHGPSSQVDPILRTFDPGDDVISGDLIADIMLQAGLEYTIDASLENITISDVDNNSFGRLPVGTFRECLQLVLFRIGAYATTSRSGVIQIRPIELASDLISYDHTITEAQKGLQSPVDRRPLVTGVEVTSHDYQPDLVSGPLRIAELNLSTGTHRIVFENGQEIWSYEHVAGGTGTTSFSAYGSAWADLNVSVTGTLFFDGVQRMHHKQIHGVYGTFPAGTAANVIQITDALLVDKASAPTIAQRVYDYYSQRYIQKTRLYASTVAPGDSVLINTQSGKQIAGIIEKMTTDLAGGFVQDVEIVGVVLP